MIDIQNVSLQIKKAKILNQINLHVESGKIYGLVGRNGSGKTMLMKTVCGFVPATEGRVLVEGKEIGKEVDFPLSIGVMIETPSFLKNETGYANLHTLSNMKAHLPAEVILDYIAMVGLDPHEKKTVKKYSLGMRQRLGIAQALMEQPRLLVLDEPFNGLDDEGVVLVRDLLLQEKQKGTTILLSSHTKEDIEILCDVVVRLQKGSIISINTKG